MTKFSGMTFTSMNQGPGKLTVEEGHKMRYLARLAMQTGGESWGLGKNLYNAVDTADAKQARHFYAKLKEMVGK